MSSSAVQPETSKSSSFVRDLKDDKSRIPSHRCRISRDRLSPGKVDRSWIPMHPERFTSTRLCTPASGDKSDKGDSVIDRYLRELMLDSAAISSIASA